MSKNIEKNKNMGEVLVRILCFLLGVFMTISAVLIRERMTTVIEPVAEAEEEQDIAEPQPEEEESEQDTNSINSMIIYSDDENMLENESTIGDSHVSVAVLDNYTEEAEAKVEEMKAKDEEARQLLEQPVLEADDSVNATTRIIANMDGKPSKLNWKPFYAAINNTIGTKLTAKEQERSSYEETLATNAFDKMVIADSTIDFSGVTIAVLGDSISAGSNLSEEDAEKYNWPKQMEEILGCTVLNYAIGGSSVSSCATTDPMCERWNDIPSEVDVIIVFGGTNDCLFETRDQFGHLEYDLRMNENTFCGDLDRMLSNMKWTFRDHMDDHYIKMIYVNPPSTILNDGVVAVDPNKYVPQWEFADAINEMAPNYGFDVIDLYNTNFLNSHDHVINSEFILDGVHGNVAAYQILAEHMSSQIIQMIEQ